MKINLTKTTWQDFVITFGDNEKVMAAALDSVTARIDFDLWQLTLGDFGAVLRGELPASIVRFFNPALSASDVLSARKAINHFFDEFVKLCEQHTPKQTADERLAGANVETFNQNEGMLVFARSYFGLKNFTEAEAVTLADFYLAQKDNYISVTYQRALTKIIDNRQKMKFKR